MAAKRKSAGSKNSKSKRSTKSKSSGIRTAAKKGARKASSSGIVKKAKKAVGEIIKGAASGAVKGAFEAGEKQVGIEPGQAQQPSEKIGKKGAMSKTTARSTSAQSKSARGSAGSSKRR